MPIQLFLNPLRGYYLCVFLRYHKACAIQLSDYTWEKQPDSKLADHVFSIFLNETAMIEIDNAVLKDMNHGFCLPAKPELLQSLHQVLQQPEPELGEIAALIATDVATSAAVLKVINSSSYGFSRTITDIRQAVMFLGQCSGNCRCGDTDWQ